MFEQQVLVCGTSGVIATALTHPLDTWAVHRQTGRPLIFTPRNLYRGISPACFQASLIYGVFLGSYEYARNPQGLDFGIIGAAAASAIPESIVKGPLEALKNMRQTGTKLPRPILTAGALRLLAATGGILAREVCCFGFH